MATTNSISSLLSQIPDANLRAELSRAVEEALRDRHFGLVFEEHLPEVQALSGVTIRIGTRVAIAEEPLNCTWRVESLETRGVAQWAKLRREGGLEGEIQRRDDVNVASLIPVARYGEAIYPSLRAMERLERAPDAPFHSIINADNYHALQLLLYGYQRAFDVIYIDPPYNTGARDWKYNNDYIDKNDRFRHSKWLSMMKKRLLLAKKLLKPDGVLVVAIDENEVHHLGCLLDELFPGYSRQLVTIVTNQKGVAQGRLSRVEEYAYFCFGPNVTLAAQNDDLLSPDRREQKRFQTPRWEWLLRGGTNSRREDRKNLFFPIYIDPTIPTITSVGEPLDLSEKPELNNEKTVAWAIRGDGSLGNWRVSPPTLREYIKKGYVKLGGYDAQRKTWTILYLGEKAQKQIEEGTITIIGRDPKTEVVQLGYAFGEQRQIKTVWHRGTHDAGTYGSSLLRIILGEGGLFAFPKSLYAVRDALNTIVRDKPDALILDFFAGSGTTLHATCLLNAEDGGNRRCVLVTNNEVSESEAKALTKQGFKPGDEEWEREGICRAVTIPRCKYAINGARDDGTPLGGTYLSGRALSEGFEANLQAFSLDFLDPLAVIRGGRFSDIAPILWLLAGARGDLISDEDIADESKAWIWPQNSEMMVCRDDTRFGEVLEELEGLEARLTTRLRHIFLVTNAREAWMEWRETLLALLPHVQVHQLYRDYLENYRLGENRTITDESLVSTLDEEP